MTHLETLKHGYQLFSEGKIEEVLLLFTEDIEWNECKSFPFVNETGTYIGPQAVFEGVFAQLPAYYDNFNIEITEFVDGGDKIVMIGFYTGIWKPTGKQFKANATHSWTIRDGKMCAFFQAVDTAEIINP